MCMHVHTDKGNTPRCTRFPERQSVHVYHDWCINGTTFFQNETINIFYTHIYTCQRQTGLQTSFPPGQGTSIHIQNRKMLTWTTSMKMMIGIVQKNYVLPFKSNLGMMQVATAHNSRTSLIYSVCALLSLSWRVFNWCTKFEPWLGMLSNCGSFKETGRYGQGDSTALSRIFELQVCTAALRAAAATPAPVQCSRKWADSSKQSVSKYLQRWYMGRLPWLTRDVV